jgi:hypothetical protein
MSDIATDAGVGICCEFEYAIPHSGDVAANVARAEVLHRESPRQRVFVM